MIWKTISPGSWSSLVDGQAASLVEPVNGRFFKEAFVSKEAAMFEELTKDLKPKKGKAYLHVISAGSLDKYGPNSNGDSFNMKEADFRIPFPKEGCPGVYRMDGGLLKYHDKTFQKEGRVYKNHQNGLKKGSPSGMVVEACVNPHMQRGELLVEVAEDKWEKELEKLASGENIYFSIGALVPFDTCSICGNQAASRDDYCTHLKENIGEMSKEGYLVHAINDQPTFHDISGVARPADRIACGLWMMRGGMEKAASADIWTPAPARVYAKEAGINVSDLLSKMAGMEKKIIVMAGGDALGKGAPKDLPKDVIREMAPFPLEDILAGLSEERCMLSPDSFLRLVLGDRYGEAEDDAKQVAGVLPMLYSKLDGCSPEERGDFLDDGSYEPSGRIPISVRITIRKVVPMCSLDPAMVADRAASSVLEDCGKGDDEGKKTSKEASGGAGLLAREYARYQLSFLGRFPKEAEMAVVAAGNMSR